MGALSKLVNFFYILSLKVKNATDPSLSVCVKKLRGLKQKGLAYGVGRLNIKNKAEYEVMWCMDVCGCTVKFGCLPYIYMLL